MLKFFFMRPLATYLFLGLLFITFNGCHLFETTKVPAKEIKAASSWSDNDQAPTFPECEGIEDQAEKQYCFESLISNTILDYLAENPWESSEILQEEIMLILKIDQEGFFTLEEVTYSNQIDSAIPSLEENLQMAVNSIPQAMPAMKSNVGTMVATTFKLPILINAQ